MPHEQENPVLVVKKILWPHKNLCNTKDELKAKIMAAFSNLDEEAVGKAWRRFQSRLEAVIEVDGDFFE